MAALRSALDLLETCPNYQAHLAEMVDADC